MAEALTTPPIRLFRGASNHQGKGENIEGSENRKKGGEGFFTGCVPSLKKKVKMGGKRQNLSTPPNQNEGNQIRKQGGPGQKGPCKIRKVKGKKRELRYYSKKER